ncbi:MAG: hypothetical protein IPI19_18955 [Ignavibacteriales bacterium]|nr:hypothetical protein [Ignavibacteriales bacterium]
MIELVSRFTGWYKFLQNIQVIRFLINDQAWELSGVGEGTVQNDNGILKMYYMNSLETGFGIATSTNGINGLNQFKSILYYFKYI